MQCVRESDFPLLCQESVENNLNENNYFIIIGISSLIQFTVHGWSRPRKLQKIIAEEPCGKATHLTLDRKQRGKVEGQGIPTGHLQLLRLPSSLKQHGQLASTLEQVAYISHSNYNTTNGITSSICPLAYLTLIFLRVAAIFSTLLATFPQITFSGFPTNMFICPDKRSGLDSFTVSHNP